MNPVPVIVTDVPPAVGPAVGLTAVTVGAGTYVNLSALPVAEAAAGVGHGHVDRRRCLGRAVGRDRRAELTVTLVAATSPKLTAVARGETRCR